MADPDDDDDDIFGNDPELERFADEFERRESALHDLVSQFMDDEEIDEAYTGQMLLSLALKMRMMSYVMETEKPSAAGLKIDLERMHQELGQFVRDAKKGAAEYIELAKAARDEVMREAEEEEEEEDGEGKDGGGENGEGKKEK